MKTLYLFLLTLSAWVLVAPAALAQRSRVTDYDAVTFYRVGMQSVGLNDINQALQQAGYSPLSPQTPTLSIASQLTRPNRPLSFHSELGVAFGSGLSVVNGTYKAKASFYYVKFGGMYRLIGTDKFQLSPQLSLVSLPFQLTVSPISNATPPLNTVLTNPGSTQTATLRTSNIAIDAGVMASLRFPYGSPRQYDCSTVERSIVIGLDAGYRVAANSPLDGTREVSAVNPAVQLSGWYAGLRFGFGRRVRSTTAPVSL